MKYYIYQLMTNNDVFYIGRTINPSRRLQEHIRGGQDANSTELKYQFINQLNQLNQSWEMQVIATYTDNNHNYEDYHIYTALLNGHHLTNMRKGDVYTEAEKQLKCSYSTPEEFFTAREAVIKRQSLKQKSTVSYKQQQSSTGTTVFIDDLSKINKQQSSALAAIRQRIKSRTR